MKKIYFLFCLSLLSLTGWSQSFNGPTTAISGSTVTLTAPGENYVSTDFTTPWYYFTHINRIDETKSYYQNYSGTTDPKTYMHVSLVEVTNLFTPLNRRPSTIRVNLVNGFGATTPITVTFYIETQYGHNPNTETGIVYIPYTLTVTPPPTAPSGTYYNVGKVETYTVESSAGTSKFSLGVYKSQYSSTISAQDADTKAVRALIANRQAYLSAHYPANAKITLTQVRAWELFSSSPDYNTLK